MKKTAIKTIMAVAVVAVAFPVFGAGGSGGKGRGSGACANCTNRTAATKPACDGTGPKGPGAGSQRPLDGRGRQHHGGIEAQQPAPTQPQTEQTPPSTN